jgi:putative transposase
MNDYKTLAHTTWDCKYHVVFIPKCRRKELYGDLRKYLGEVFQGLAGQRDCRIEEGHLMPDHIHMMLSVPPKYSQVVGFMKGKSAIQIARNYMGKRRNYAGENFWADGFFVSTTGKDEELVREYIQRQEEEDKRLDQLQLL